MLYHKRTNNFDAVRLSLATVVMFDHFSWIFSGNYGVVSSVLKYFNGPCAVECFFVISGFLIFRSFKKSRGLLNYASNRACRIYPALVGVIVGSVVLGALITSISLKEYFASSTVRYVVYNLFFMSFNRNTLPGVFDINQLNLVNGSLWTLKIEVMFYCAVPIIIFLSKKVVRFEILAIAIYILSVSFRIIMDHLAIKTHMHIYGLWGSQLPGQLSFFVAGGLLEHCIQGFFQHARKYLTLAILGLIIASRLGAYPLYPASLAIVVIYVCQVFPYLGHISKYGDFSYGLYVWHFPIMQTVAALAFLADSPVLRAIVTITLCFLCAVLSWHLVEKRWLTLTKGRSLLLPSNGPALDERLTPLEARALQLPK